MKKRSIIPIFVILFFLLVSPLTAQAKKSKSATLVVPEESIVTFIQPLLPFKIDFGKQFSGSFWIQSIKNLNIEKEKISFSSHIVGKDVGYETKLGKRKVFFELGNVNLHNQWTGSLRYDKVKKKLWVKPHITGPSDQKGLSQGDIIVNTLLEAFNDIEYPIDLDKLKPITTKIFDQEMLIHVDIADIYTGDSKLFLKFRPRAQVDKSKGQ